LKHGAHSPQAQFWILVLAAAGIIAITMGVRAVLGLFISPINSATGAGIVALSFALAVNHLMWGAFQPVFGAIADRFGATRVIVLGGILLAGALVLVPFATSATGLVLTLGIGVAAGAAAGSMSTLLGAVGQRIPFERRGFATGIVNAGGSTGQLVLAPVATGLILAIGWANAFYALALIALATLPLALPLLRKSAPPAAAEQVRSDAATSAPAAAPPGMRAALRTAARDPSYWYLNIGFFVCGFHIAFLLTHMPGVIEICGLPATLAGTSLAVIGLFNIVGSIGSGIIVQRFRMKLTLAWLYAARGVGVAAFLVAPKTELVILLFSVWMGLTWLATVPPTAGLVGKLFGTRYLATLFGITLFSHQIGGFFGAWLGGIAIEATGSYDWMWYADMALAALATIINLPIREQKMGRFAPA
jgi:MFS family permease